MPSLSAQISLSVQKQYESILSSYSDEGLLNLVLIAITQEAHVKALSVIRGQRFSEKVDMELLKLDQTYKVVCLVCYEGDQEGMSIEKSITEFLISSSDDADNLDIDTLEEFISLYREKAYKVAGEAVGN